MAEARRVVDKAIDEAVLKTAALRGVEAPATAIEAQGVAALLAWSEEGLA